MFLLVAKSSLGGCCLATYVPRMYIYRVFHHYFTPNISSSAPKTSIAGFQLRGYLNISKFRLLGESLPFFETHVSTTRTRAAQFFLFFLLCKVRPRCPQNAIWFVRLNLNYRSLACSHVLRTRLTLYSIVWLWNYVLEYRRLKISFYSLRSDHISYYI
jgi:hypothetical protein